jgi:hypothetical protein
MSTLALDAFRRSSSAALEMCTPASLRVSGGPIRAAVSAKGKLEGARHFVGAPSASPPQAQPRICWLSILGNSFPLPVVLGLSRGFPPSTHASVTRGFPSNLLR